MVPDLLQHFYNVSNTFFENDSNGTDDDEVDDVHGYDENGDSENETLLPWNATLLKVKSMKQ